jgi:hypothetical protein
MLSRVAKREARRSRHTQSLADVSNQRVLMMNKKGYIEIIG